MENLLAYYPGMLLFLHISFHVYGAWSVIHTYYNFGTPLPFYVGHDVYTVDSLDSWYPAYIAEAVVYLSVVVWKILLEGSEEKKLSKDNTQKPELIHSDSIESDCSQ